MRERINFWDADINHVCSAVGVMPMESSPDKCLVQDAFLRPDLEIKSEDDSGMEKKHNSAK